MLKRHRAALGLVHGYLDLSVEDAYRRLDGLRSDDLGPHGLTVGGVVRDGMRERTACEVFQQCSLSVVRKSGNGVWLTDGRYVSIRIRRRAFRAAISASPPMNVPQIPRMCKCMKFLLAVL